MQTQIKKPRLRCTICRDWYHPHPSSRHHQKTCSNECRRLRRRKQAGKRRAADPFAYREDERMRQQRCRARKRDQVGAETQPPATADQASSRSASSLSRASLQAERVVIMAEILEIWDRSVTVSRTGLVRQLHRLIREKQHLLGQTEPQNESCHVVADSRNPMNQRGKTRVN